MDRWGPRRILLVVGGSVSFALAATTALSLRSDDPASGPSFAPHEQRPIGLTVRWNPPGAFFPVLGWREPVDLRTSEIAADRQLANLDPRSFNCHFYTRFYIRRARADSVLPIPRQDLLTTQSLSEYRYRVVNGAMKPGDVLVAERPDSAGGWIFTHSALVLAVDEDGHPTRIRQKFDDRHPVVDVSGEEFRMLYAGRYPWRVQAWRCMDSRAL